MDTDKLPQDKVLTPDQAPLDAIVSPDTRRAGRIPPHQVRTKKWPVLDAFGPPQVELSRWQFQMWGLVDRDISFSWMEFQALPQVTVFADFHCVTRWSRLGNVWQGVSTRELVRRAGGLKPDARFVLAHGYDNGWTTNMPLDQFLAEDALVALLHDGEPISPDHGGPARLIVPQLYAWKSAKWVKGVEFLADDRAGYWERNGYHMNGDPWKEERYR